VPLRDRLPGAALQWGQPVGQLVHRVVGADGRPRQLHAGPFRVGSHGQHSMRSSWAAGATVAGRRASIRVRRGIQAGRSAQPHGGGFPATAHRLDQRPEAGGAHPGVVERLGVGLRPVPSRSRWVATKMGGGSRAGSLPSSRYRAATRALRHWVGRECLTAGRLEGLEQCHGGDILGAPDSPGGLAPNWRCRRRAAARRVGAAPPAAKRRA
jgi:hypothetical protein